MRPAAIRYATRTSISSPTLQATSLAVFIDPKSHPAFFHVGRRSPRRWGGLQCKAKLPSSIPAPSEGSTSGEGREKIIGDGEAKPQAASDIGPMTSGGQRTRACPTHECGIWRVA